jgi:hypothetical protein
MPTGTSTIFGVFQAILALLLNRTNSARWDKLMRIENFASEIFCMSTTVLCCSAKGRIHWRARLASKRRGINTFTATLLNPDADFGATS